MEFGIGQELVFVVLSYNCCVHACSNVMLTFVCGGVVENRNMIPRFSYGVTSWEKGVAGAVLLIVTISWRILLLVGIYFGFDNATL